MGLSVVAPGFSGSIIAIIMGIYQDLLRIASNPFKKFKENVAFCVPLGIGAAVSAVLFVLVFKYLFEAHEKATYFLFIGLIAGNIPIIADEIKKGGFKKSYLFGMAAALACALALSIFAVSLSQASGAGGVTSSLPMFALGGFVGGVAAPIPGMSVSMVLILTGVYNQVIVAAEAVLRFSFDYLVQLGVFGVSAVLGVVAVSRVIRIVFEKLPGFANSLVFGFMTGSLAGLLVQSFRLYDAGFNWILGGAMLLTGLVFSMVFVVLGKLMAKNNIVEEGTE